ncbi:hypothetical protein CLIM01_03729 [Colletotrichum limetticola]|uniref:Uncharacterized protein n=1 Tax=Colletotrichum limetticola TaxID=1209924 RepID=A0ABQ9Q521_9PEZI|nr:hypothetical protein CLIM01_03729 [Colletotrichum limetticola]
MWSFTTQNLVPTLLRSPIFSKPIQPFPAWLLSSRHASRLRSRPGRADLLHPSTSIPPGFSSQQQQRSQDQGPGEDAGKEKSIENGIVSRR